jgi:hypothetical protein
MGELAEEARRCSEAEAAEERRRQEERNAKLRRTQEEKAKAGERRATGLARTSWKAGGGADSPL